ncbi:hypothetical protein DNI29_17050 [Hymenobacter sediminis]|uniref:hypothetical protein n=1 Tax=Hymenobacter sediminis TaxID=2218621 RepID=UPI000DA690BE|nr:hypothetical protein [Hymenobacter sediminis]RPD45856.1 hypothetical protein DNI29_17050 [Hymenobacter sediminis]
MTRFLVSAPLRLTLAALLSSTLLTSCLDDKEPSCSSDALAPTLAVVSPKTGTVNTPVEVRYTIQIANSCGQFKSLTEQRNGNNIYLSPLVSYEGCSCPQIASDYTGSFKFTAPTPGKYVFHFLKLDNTILTDTLTVQ